MESRGGPRRPDEDGMADDPTERRVSGRRREAGPARWADRQPPPTPPCYPCPICGALVREEHGQFRCTGCGQIVEACCEGAPPPL